MCDVLGQQEYGATSFQDRSSSGGRAVQANVQSEDTTAGNKSWCSVNRNDFEPCCKDFGISYESSFPCTPSQTEECERNGRRIAAKTRFLVNEANLRHFLWSELAATAVYLPNRIPTSTIGMGNPYHLLFEKGENLAHLLPIDARTFVHQKQNTGELAEKASEVRLVIYDRDNSTYEIFSASTRNPLHSRNISFIETPTRSIGSCRRQHDQEEITIPGHLT